MPLTDPPGRRLPWDVDGSQVFCYRPSDAYTWEWSVGYKQVLNNDYNDYMGGNDAAGVFRPGAVWNVIYFPGQRDITHLYSYWGGNAIYVPSGASVQGSTDSTAPNNGTWNAITGLTNGSSGGLDPTIARRTSISPVTGAVSGIVALRFGSYWDDGNSFMYEFHIYGVRAAGDTFHQVAFTDSAGNRLTKDFDFGDKARGGTYTWKSPNLYNQTTELYVKNFGSTQANGVTVSKDSLGGTNLPTDISFSTDNVTYGATASLGNIVNGAVAGPVYVRYAPPATRLVGPDAGRIKVAVTSWS